VREHLRIKRDKRETTFEEASTASSGPSWSFIIVSITVVARRPKTGIAATIVRVMLLNREYENASWALEDRSSDGKA
jgi:hypothetical protein